MISQATIDSILQDIRTGNDTDYVNAFFAARPDWEDKTNGQTDDGQKEKAETAGRSPGRSSIGGYFYEE